MGQGGNDGRGEEWLDPGYIFKAESRGFTDGLKCSVREREVSEMTPVFLCWPTGRLGLLFSEIQNYRKIKFWVEGNQKFDFRYVKFEMTNKHLSGDVKMVVRYLNLEFRKKIKLLYKYELALY